MRVRQLFPVIGQPDRKPREVDVVVTLQGPSGPLRVAFECRNRKGKVGPDQIHAFQRKLEEIGFAVPQSVFVTTSAFTSGGLQAAEAVGIQPLLAEGLTKERLALVVRRATAHRLFFVLWPKTLQLLNDVTSSSKELPASDFVLDLADMGSPLENLRTMLGGLAELWCSGVISATLGAHGGWFRVPDGYCFHPGVGAAKDGLIWVNLCVYAAAFSREGTAEVAALRHARTHSTTHFGAAWAFPDFTGGKSESFISTDQELAQYLTASGSSASFLESIRVPRVPYETFWWPLSQQALDRAAALSLEGAPLSFEAVETGNLARAWSEDPRASHGLGSGQEEE